LGAEPPPPKVGGSVTKIGAYNDVSYILQFPPKNNSAAPHQLCHKKILAMLLLAIFINMLKVDENIYLTYYIL